MSDNRRKTKLSPGDMLTHANKLMRKSTSKERRKRSLRELYERSNFSSILVDKAFDYCFGQDFDGPRFIAFLQQQHERVTLGLPKFVEFLEAETVQRVNDSLVGYYADDHPEVAVAIKRWNDQGKLVFEFASDNASAWHDKHTQHFRDALRASKEKGYDYRGILERVDALIMYHGTSSFFDSQVAQEGLQPPSISGLDTSEQIAESARKIGRQDVDAVVEELTVKRKDFTYFSIGRPTLCQGTTMEHNSDVQMFMERAVEFWGGEGRLYRCLMPTARLLPDEDAEGVLRQADLKYEVTDYVGSLYLEGSAKVEGGLAEDVFRVPGDKVPRYVDRSPDALKFEHLMKNPDSLEVAFYERFGWGGEV